MGIWGELREIWLPDLLALLAERQGVLVLKAPKRPALVVEISGGRLGTVREAKRPLPRHRIEERFLALMEIPETAFNFRADDRVPPARGPELRALAERLRTLYAEIRSVRNRLPSPGARFVLKDPRACADPRWAPVFEKAKRHLRQGASALELAELLRIPLPLAQYFLLQASRARRVGPERLPERPTRRIANRLLGRLAPMP